MGPQDTSARTLAGYLAGIVLGTTSVTLLFLGMRAVMDVGGACADGGPYVSAQPCPEGTPLAMVGGMFGLFGSAGLIVWFGSRISKAAASVVALGWPALFLSLGFNFLDYGFHPPDAEPTPVWGWFIPGVLFWLLGGAPLAVAILAWRETRAGRPGNRLTSQVAASIPDRPAVFGVRPRHAITRVDTTNSAPPKRDGASDTETLDLVDDPSRLAALHGSGNLTDEEFAATKLERLTEPDRLA